MKSGKKRTPAQPVSGRKRMTIDNPVRVVRPPDADKKS